MGWMERLVANRRSRVARELMLLYGLDMPASVKVGEGLRLQHRGMGTVIHTDTVIGDRVQLYHQVTIGRRDAHLPWEDSDMDHIEIGNDVILFPGARVLGGPGVTRIGDGCIIAANAVIAHSTGENEIWAGIPAKLVGHRKLP